MIALAMHPAGKAYLLAGVFLAKRAAGMRAVSVHFLGGIQLICEARKGACTPPNVKEMLPRPRPDCGVYFSGWINA